jgi:hypothetical protein
VTDYANLAAQYEGPPATPAKSARRTQAQILLELAADAELFRTPAGELYAAIPVEGHTETWRLSSAPLRRWLRRRFYESEQKPPTAQALADALAELEARAQFGEAETTVFIRTTERDGAIYLDLANASWEAVRITPLGWEVVPQPPVRFRRTKGMAALPHPTSGGSLGELQPFLTTGGEEWPLLLGWLVAAIRPTGPYPALILQGEQGSAKSTTARLLRALVDPSIAPLQAPPREERDLMIAAANSWILAFDNLSRLTDWMADALCRIATGGGFRTRELYTDSEEVIFDGQRPIILNGIDELAARGDLRDRALILTLPPLDDRRRLDERTLWQRFYATQPRLLGALCDAVSHGLRRLPDTQLSAAPRMADFARWVTSCEPGLGVEAGTFLTSYWENRKAAVATSVEFNAVAQAVIALMESQDEWRGTATQLLGRLNETAPSDLRTRRDWPATPEAVANRLRRAAPDLRAVGIETEFFRQNKRRLVSLRRETAGAVTTVTAVTMAPLPLLPGDGIGAGDGRVSRLSPKEARLSPSGDGRDGADAREPISSSDSSSHGPEPPTDRSDVQEPESPAGNPQPGSAYADVHGPGLRPTRPRARAVPDSCSKCGTPRRYLPDGARCCPTCYPDAGGLGWAEEVP